MKRIQILSIIGYAIAITACTEENKVEEQVQKALEPSLDTLRLALDWSPNVLHAGIFYADYSGKLAEHGIYLDWFTTEIDDYKKKPIQRLLDREVDLAIGPSEHLFYFGDTSEQQFAVAVATILQQDQSAFAVKTNSGITSPQALDNKTYIGYNTPLENNILRSMIQHDGGKGTFESVTPPRLSVWEAFMKNEGDAVWIFTHWEGALAKAKGEQLNYFYPADFGVPYGYSSVIMANQSRTAEKDALIQRLLTVLRRAHQTLVTLDTEDVVKMLQDYHKHPNFEDTEMLTLAWEDIRFSFLNPEGSWGVMQHEVWQKYYDWIAQQEATAVPQNVQDVRLFYEAFEVE
ncbi:MAG: ABC transporter substrate-binding protein [Crocinitomicaceae bacterium]|nr:ABC transporter substrate-binding protein [Crocinitomicaceae bacterium]